MNAVEFKEKLGKSRERDIVEFLESYKKEWNETVEETVDKTLNEHANNSKTTEPFEIVCLNHKILRVGGEWEEIKYIPSDKAIISISPYDYKDDKYYYNFRIEEDLVKRKWLWNKKVVEGKYYRRIYEKNKKVLYRNLNSLQKIYLQKIFKDKGFFVGENSFESTLYVYWNKEQYDLAMK